MQTQRKKTRLEQKISRLASKAHAQAQAVLPMPFFVSSGAECSPADAIRLGQTASQASPYGSEFCSNLSRVVSAMQFRMDGQGCIPAIPCIASEQG